MPRRSRQPLAPIPPEAIAAGLPDPKDKLQEFNTILSAQDAIRVGKFQGGQIMFIVAGRGHTILDGVKHAWDAGDVLNLPCKRDGIVVQHFNDDPTKPAAFLAVEPNLFAATGVDRGCGFHQLEQSLDYRRQVMTND